MAKETLLRKWMTRQLPVVMVLAVLLTLCLVSAAAAESGKTDTVVTQVEINTSNATTLDTAALPAGFELTRKPVDVRLELNETQVPAPKGEMAAGPRFIGVSIDPVVMAAGITVLVIIGIIAWYSLRRRTGPEDMEEKEEPEKSE